MRFGQFYAKLNITLLVSFGCNTIYLKFLYNGVGTLLNCSACRFTLSCTRSNHYDSKKHTIVRMSNCTKRKITGEMLCAINALNWGCSHSDKHAHWKTSRRNVRSKIWWFTRFCNSSYVSHFAAFFIVVEAKTSVAESCIVNIYFL